MRSSKLIILLLILTIVTGCGGGGGGGGAGGVGVNTAATNTLVSIAITPANPSIAVGRIQQFAATGTFSDGTTQELTSSVNWSSANTAVATISNTAGINGAATAVAAGTATFTATSGNVSASAAMTVSVSSNATIYVSDTFQASGTSTELQNHIGDTGAGWAILFGSELEYIDGPNSAVYSTAYSDANYYNTYNIPANDYSVIANVHINIPVSGNAFVSGRTNPSTHARYDAGHTDGLGWGLYYMDGLGHETLLAPLYGPTILPPNTNYTLELRIVGSNISMYVNNVLAASVTNTVLPTGNNAGLETIGTGAGSNGSYELSDWQVTSPSAR